MANSEIKEYVEQTRKTGYSDAQIRQSLKNAGWNNTDINDALGLKASEPDFTPPAPVNQTAQQPSVNQTKSEKTNVLAIIALICAFFFPLIGLILGFVAKNQIKKTGEKGKGLATAAIIISIVSIVLYILLLLVIPFMAYFGVMDPSKMLPERCQFPAGMDCIDKASIDGTTDTITVALRNNQGFPVTIDSATVLSGCDRPVVYVGSSAVSNAIPYATPIPNNEMFRVKFSNCNLKAGNKFDSDITIGYTNQETSLSNQAVGSVRGSVS
jgi:peptidyl-prolyl cis-trans isomerase B (cyclophilin B)